MEIIEVEQNGKRYSAEYSLVDNVVTVFGDTDQQSTQTGGLTAEQTAKMLLRNLIRKGCIKPMNI